MRFQFGTPAIGIADASQSIQKQRERIVEFLGLGSVYRSIQIIWLSRQSKCHVEISIPQAAVMGTCVADNYKAPCVREVVRCSTFLYFSGGRDRTLTWDTHRNADLRC